MISHRNISKSRKFETQLYDPRISRIEKNIAKNRPKLLDLYASIYGAYFQERLLWVSFKKECPSTNKTLITSKILFPVCVISCS
jgi:hypothetical protein